MSIVNKTKNNKPSITKCKNNDKFTIDNIKSNDDIDSQISSETNAQTKLKLKARTRRNRQDMPWVDKYRPLKLDDVVHQTDVIKVLKNIVQTGNMPHLLFHGPAGTGKCLAPDTPVLLYTGEEKTAECINVGDILMGDDETPRYVYSTVIGTDTMYKIKQHYGIDYTVNSEHMISLKLMIPYIVTTNFEKGGYDIIYFENFIMHNKFVNNVNDFNFTLSTDNKKYDICDISVKDYLEKGELWQKCFKGFKCNALNPDAWNEHKNDAFFNGYNLNVEIDTNIAYSYRTTNLETRTNFIMGLFRQLDNNEFRTRNKDIFDSVIFILRSLGHMVECVKKAMYYCCRIIKSNTRTYDITIEKLDVGKYCGFEISGNKRFLLGDFTVTHNTSCILAITNELFGPNKVDERVIELNASDERGINIVRNKIVTLAKTSISEKDPNYICPPYKIIILDEADAMTVEAQSALRKTMEDNSNITRFCFICNYINQIIGPIISRCVKFRFKPIDLEQTNKKLRYIANKENMDITEDAIKTIYDTSNGDMRKAITLLQNLNYLNKQINTNDVCLMACVIPNNALMNIINICTETGDSANKIANLTNNLIRDGYPLTNILEQLVHEIAKNDKLTDKMKSIICLHIANTEQRLTCGADEYMQLLSVFMCIKNISNDLRSVYDM
jgi:replication factor C subunit 2/4